MMVKDWTIPVLALGLIFTHGTAKASSVYWNLFNFEEESLQVANYVTYDSLLDMLNDTNRTGTFVPDTVGSAAHNVVGSGSDGSTYWNLFNFEEESLQAANYVTYNSLLDMLNDTNRTGTFVPDTVGSSAHNVVGSGASVMAMTAVPESSTLALFGLGLAGFGFAARRRKTR